MQLKKKIKKKSAFALSYMQTYQMANIPDTST